MFAKCNDRNQRSLSIQLLDQQSPKKWISYHDKIIIGFVDLYVIERYLQIEER